jgi:hypothetical protein
MNGTVGTLYEQNITVKIPKDTVQSPVKICFTRFELLNPSGVTNYNLPSGLSLTGTPSTLKFPGNDTSCAVIWGTPTTAGTYTVYFKISAYGNFTSMSSTCPSNPNVNSGTAISTQTLSYYKITINPLIGMEEITKQSFNLRNFPNPVVNKTAIQFFIKEETPVRLSVYNVLGAKVFDTSLETKPGNNEYELDAGNWPDGVYLYTIKCKNYSETKRIVVNGKN